jgi:hypothetical protein
VRRQGETAEEAAGCRRPPLLELAALHRRRRRRSTPPSTSSAQKTGIKSTTSRHQLERRVLRQDPAPAVAGQSIDRDIIVLTDNERFLGLMIDKGWVEELDRV